MKLQIVVAAHRPYRMPEDGAYLPVQAGRALREPLGWQGDDSGDNISAKNAEYCELTCLYWAWKNLDADAVGLCHYRRYFALRRFGPKWSRVLTGEKAAKLLQKAPVIVPRPRRYYIETNYSQYAHAHNGADLDRVRDILSQQGQRWTAAFDAVMARTWGHRWNMLIMDRPTLDKYCSWLFGVLGELEQRIDLSGYDAYGRRVFGFIGERLLDVWLEAEGVACRETPLVNMESQHWPRKIAAFLRRKFAREHG